MGHDELKEEKAVISTPRNGKPLKLIACLTSLFYHTGSIIEKSSAKEGHDTPEVDSKLRREIEMKKRGEISLHG